MSTSVLSPMSFTSYFDPVTGAALQVNLFFYKTGTLDLITVYTDANLNIPHPVPVMSSGNGRVPAVFIGEIPGEASAYRVRAFDQYSQLLEDVDGLPDVTASGGGGVDPDPPDPAYTLTTGDLVPAFTNALARDGFVFANGTYIGPASAGGVATGRANDDTHDLFVLLWGQDNTSGRLLDVQPSRGESAEGDWAAGNKAIATPDLRGRAAVGMDGMGTTPAGRLNGVTFAGGSADVLGAFGGAVTVTLTAAQMPIHQHALNETAHAHPAWTGNHSHTVSGGTDGQGSHSHNITISSAGSHNHDYRRPLYSNNLIGQGVSLQYSHGYDTVSTASDGAHTHPASADVQGFHAHNVSGSTNTLGNIGVGMDAVKTNITMNNAGEGQPHEIMTPFFLVTWYLKL